MKNCGFCWIEAICEKRNQWCEKRLKIFWAWDQINKVSYLFGSDTFQKTIELKKKSRWNSAWDDFRLEVFNFTGFYSLNYSMHFSFHKCEATSNHFSQCNVKVASCDERQVRICMWFTLGISTNEFSLWKMYSIGFVVFGTMH